MVVADRGSGLISGRRGVALAGYALIPEMLWNTAFLHERCVGFLVPALMLACEPRRSSAKLKDRTGVIILVACATWLVVFSTRLAGFNREIADYHALMDELPAGLRVRPLIFQRDSQAFPGAPAYLHVSAYYHVEKGGIPAYSFAVQPSAVIRYKDGYGSQLAPGLEWAAERFDARSEAAFYDYFLMRGDPVEPDPFLNSPVPIVLDACHGRFCGYRRAAPLAVSVPEFLFARARQLIRHKSFS